MHMKKILSIVTLVLFTIAMTAPVVAKDPPKDSLKTEKTCRKKDDKTCEKKCDPKDCKISEKSSCCKAPKTKAKTK